MDQSHLKLNFSQFIIEKQNSYTDDYKLGVHTSFTLGRLRRRRLLPGSKGHSQKNQGDPSDESHLEIAALQRRIAAEVHKRNTRAKTVGPSAHSEALRVLPG